MTADKGTPLPRPIKLVRCQFHWACGALIAWWRLGCWKHECEMREGWPEA